MSFVTHPASLAWRLPIACQILFALVVVAMVPGLPESPRYLYAHDRPAEALAVLCRVYGRAEDDARIVKEQGEILETLAMERQHGEYRWSQLLKRDEVQTGRRVGLAYGMQFMNQMGGINLVVYYISEFLFFYSPSWVGYFLTRYWLASVLQLNVGLSRNLSLLLGGVINTMFIIGSLFPSFFLDRYGRRKPMMWGSAGLGLCMMMISILLSFQDRGGPVAKATSSASVAFFFLYMVSVLCAGCPWPLGRCIDNLLF